MQEEGDEHTHDYIRVAPRRKAVRVNIRQSDRRRGRRRRKREGSRLHLKGSNRVLIVIYGLLCVLIKSQEITERYVLRCVLACRTQR